MITRDGIKVSVARVNSYHVWWAPDAFGLIWKGRATLELAAGKSLRMPWK